MARIRSIKPEFPQSETVGSLSRDARLLFIMLWTLVDDDGRARAASRMLASLLYPYDDDAPKLIDGWLDELEQAECIRRYEVDGSQYLDVPNWLKHQKIDKPSKSRLPSFDEASPNPREPSRTLAPDLGPSIEDHRTKDHSSREVALDDFPSDAFEKFYEEFPKHVAPIEARKAFERVRKRKLATFEALMAGARRYANERHGQDKQFTKAPAAWLNAGRWQDEAEKDAPTSLAYAARPETQQWDAWKAHFLASNSRFMLARMERAREENKPVELDSEWPPGWVLGKVSRETIPNAQGRGS